MRYLDPKNDLTFKKIFCEHPAILMNMLNSLLDFKRGEHITSIAYLPPDLSPTNPFLKNSIVDVRCTDNRDRQFIVEMQMIWSRSFTSRVMFNASKAYVKQLDKGTHYSALHPVYSVNLVNEVFLPKKRGYYHDYKIVNSTEGQHVLEGLSFLFIELPKINEHNLPKSIDRALWLRFFTEIKDNAEAISEELEKNPSIREALEILEESAFTNAELEQYDRYWDSVSTERTRRDDMETANAEARKEAATAKKEAATARKEAATAREEAATAREQAEKAEIQREAAEIQREKADIQRKEAEIQRGEAEIQRGEAETRADEIQKQANQQKITAMKILLASGLDKATVAAAYQITIEVLEKWLQ
jgi:predicted transposase/invertase (TIGR01784 family)